MGILELIFFLFLLRLVTGLRLREVDGVDRDRVVNVTGLHLREVDGVCWHRVTSQGGGLIYL